MSDEFKKKIITWNQKVARKSLSALCHDLNIDEKNSILIRFGLNALYHVPNNNIVVRIHNPARSLNEIVVETTVSRHLSFKGVGTVTLAEQFSEIYDAGGLHATVWRYLQPEERPSHFLTLFGNELHRLHAALSDFPFKLRTYNPTATIRGRIKRYRLDKPIAVRCKEVLEQELHELPTVDMLNYAYEPGPIHGDAHTGNLIWSDECIHFLDFEEVSIASRDWDLVPTCIIARRFKPDLSAAMFLDAYATGLRIQDLDPALLKIRELFMISWLALRAGQSEHVDLELKRRLDTIVEGDEAGQWKPM